MASTYSNLAIELIGTGDQDGTWGTTTNTNLGTALEEAIVGTVNQAVTGADLTLALTNSNATQVARHLRLNLTGSSGGVSNLIVPTLSGGKNYYIKNSSDTAVTVKTVAGSGILVPAGKSMSLYQDGTNVVEAANYSASYTIASGVIDNATIGVTTPNTGAFTDVILTGDTSGAITIAAPAVAGTNTLTLPASTGTLLDNNSSLASANLTGALPAIDGSALTGLGGPRQIQPITGTVASSALTIGVPDTSLAFRSATLTSGAVTTIDATPANLVVPSTATLGTVNAVQSRLYVLAINNAGTVELAVVNSAGGNNLDETTLINTTAMSAASDSKNVIYSTTARTGVAFRVVGYIESTQATAGTWATAPSTLQGYGGQALAAMSSVGYGQTYSANLAGGTRLNATTYTNTTGKPITVTIGFHASAASGTATFTVGGTVLFNASTYASMPVNQHGTFIVPPGATYITAIIGGTILALWSEFR